MVVLPPQLPLGFGPPARAVTHNHTEVVRHNAIGAPLGPIIVTSENIAHRDAPLARVGLETAALSEALNKSPPGHRFPFLSRAVALMPRLGGHPRLSFTNFP